MEDFKPIMLEAVSGANEVDALGRVIPGVNAATRAIGGEVEKVMEVLNIAREDVVLMLTMVLGRVPSEVEVERECIRLAAIAQIELAAADKRYLATEVEPQNAVIQRRKKIFQSRKRH